MQAQSKRRFANNYGLLVFILMLTVAFAALNIGTALWGSSFSLDLTHSSRYTLSPQTQEFLQNNKQPLFARLYISADLEREYPALAQYAQYITRLLEQYKRRSGNKLNLEILEPIPFEASEEEAKRQGIRPFLDNSGKNSLFFGAVFSNGEGGTETVPYFEPRRLNHLEHDITRLLSRLSRQGKPVIGIVSPVLDVMEKTDAFDTASNWPFINTLLADYELRWIPADQAQYPQGLDAVFVINPQNMTRLGLYALDQYLLRGGNVAVFADPFSEAFLSLNGYINSNPSQLERFLANIGVIYNEKQLVGDEAQSQTALITRDSGSQIQDYPLWLDIVPPHLNPKNPITTGLSKLRLNSVGSFKTANVLGANVTPLLLTSPKAGTVETDTAKYSAKSAVKEAYRVTGEIYSLALLLEGRFPSYFSVSPLAGTQTEDRLNPFVITSVSPGRLLLVSDSDFLFAPNWNASEYFNGQSPYDYLPFNNNTDFLERIADYLTSSGLVSLPPKNRFDRSESLENALRRKISSAYESDFQKYRTALNQAKFEQEQLQKILNRGENAASLSLIKKLEVLQRDYLGSREKLKALEYKVQTGVEYLKQQIIFLNMLIYPLILIAAVWLAAFLLRRRTKRQAVEYTHE